MQTPLSRSELNIVAQLARGCRCRDIAALMDISPGCLYSHMYNIRSKTGGLDTGNPAACGEFLANHRQPLKRINPTEKQVLELMVAGKTLPEIAVILDASPSRIAVLARQGAFNLGVRSRGKNRLPALAAALHAPVNLEDPVFQ